MGDFPDFDSMSLEEQMAWLESLAKRQGVKDEELTTKADVDIPIPENAQIDEPGYVPFEGSVSARKLKEAQEAAKAQAEAEPPAVEKAEEPAWFETEAVEPELQEMDLFAEAGDAADPMLWLDSLAAQPESDVEDLSGLFGDSETLAFEGGEEPFELEAAEPPAVEESAAVSADDPFGGMDPMLWLESLAKRQGAKSEELMTSADMSIEEVPEGTVIDEPGYVPFEGSVSARKLKESQEMEARREFAPAPEPELSPELEPFGALFEDAQPPELPAAEELFESEAELFSEEDSLSGADPMRWLESLAKRHGAKDEEFLTEADLSIPELPEDTVIDEPGYVEYSPFGILPPDQEIELPETQPEVEALAEFGADDDALSWLEDLAAEPGEDLSEILAFGEDMFEPVAEEAAPPVAAKAYDPRDPLGGMTDEEVAFAQAHGQLTGEQELAWLKRQAAKLAEVRESQEFDMIEVEEEPEEIVPAELPPWLLQMREDSEQVALEEAASPVGELDMPSGTVDFSDWLEEAPAPGLEMGMGEAAFDTAELTEADVDSLWGEAPATEIELEEIGLPDDSELAKFLAEGIVPEGADPLAEALDAEFDRKLVGDESEPDWYTDAVASVGGDAVVGLDIEPSLVEAREETEVVEASLVDMPDWLKETEEEIKPQLAGDEAIPDWLRDTSEVVPTAESGMPAWMAESEPEPTLLAEEELPDWLRELSEAPEEPEVIAEPLVEAAAEIAIEPAVVEVKPEPERKPEPPPAPVKPPAPVPAPPPAPVAAEPEIRRPAPAQPVVQGELLEKITQRLKTDPNDYTSRLAFARALRDGQQLMPSLDQYETLIESAQLLQDVATDLAGLSGTHAGVPRVRRLLGDAYMRRGMLQEALNAYRGALEQL